MSKGIDESQGEQSREDSKNRNASSDAEIKSEFTAAKVAAEALTLIDDHEEEVSVDGKTVRRRGIYLLPNLFTTAALFAGFYAIIAGMQSNFEAAAMAIFVAMILDGLDGRVARLTNTQSKFGAEYDSLADMVSFGVAPAMVMFNWALSDLGRFGWTAAFIYVACAALRLARFNTQIETADKNYFSGLASPSAAAVIAGVVWVFNDGVEKITLPEVEVAVLSGLLTAIVGFLMIINVAYVSFKSFDIRGRVPFIVMLLMVMVFGVVMLDPPKFLLAGFAIYALSGPVAAVYRKFGTNRQS